MPGEFDEEYPEDVVVDTIYPEDPKEATHILERWMDYKYVEVGRAHSEGDARRKAQEIANTKETSIRIRLRNKWDD